MREKTIRNSIIGAVLILIVAQFLNTILAVSSFEQTYRNTIISQFKIIGRDLRNEIETGVGFGKPISLYNGMTELLAKNKTKQSQIEHVYVTLPGNQILYSSDGTMVGYRLGDESFPVFPTKQDPANPAVSTVTNLNGKIFVSLPVYYNFAEWVGTVHLQFSDEIIKSRIRAVIADTLVYLLPILGIGIALLIVIGFLVSKAHLRKEKENKGSKLGLIMKNSFVLVAVLIASQGLYAWLNNSYFKAAYESAFYENIQTLSSSIDSEFEHILEHDIPLDRLKGADKQLVERLRSNTEALQISITDPIGTVLYRSISRGEEILGNSILEESRTGLPGLRLNLNNSRTQFVTELSYNNLPIGNLVIGVNVDLIQRQLDENLLDAITVIVVSLILSLELIGLLFILFGRNRSADPRGEQPQTAVVDAVG